MAFTWTIRMQRQHEKGNVTTTKKMETTHMNPAIYCSHWLTLSSDSQRLLGLSSMIGDS